MASARFGSVISAISLGVGCFLGTKIEKYRNTKPLSTDLFKDSSDTDSVVLGGENSYKYYFPLPVVSAASSIVPSVRDVAVTPSSKPTGKGAKLVGFCFIYCISLILFFLESSEGALH